MSLDWEDNSGEYINLRLEGGDIGKGTEGKDYSTTLFHRMIIASYFEPLTSSRLRILSRFAIGSLTTLSQL